MLITTIFKTTLQLFNNYTITTLLCVYLFDCVCVCVRVFVSRHGMPIFLWRSKCNSLADVHFPFLNKVIPNWIDCLFVILWNDFSVGTVSEWNCFCQWHAFTAMCIQMYICMYVCSNRNGKLIIAEITNMHTTCNNKKQNSGSSAMSLSLWQW